MSGQSRKAHIENQGLDLVFVVRGYCRQQLSTWRLVGQLLGSRYLPITGTGAPSRMQVNETVAVDLETGELVWRYTGNTDETLADDRDVMQLALALELLDAGAIYRRLLQAPVLAER